MCGIAGYKSSRPIDERVLSTMVEAVRHRGPDASGFHRSGDYAGGMRRLSINDLEGGNQPLFNEDRSVVLLYNGEIYNSPELRRGLEARQHRFRTHSDGEVICHMYAEHGERLFERLDGMFAAALWIERERKLILARDIPGEKPLYYAMLSDTDVAFASEIKSLSTLPGLDLSLDQQALWDFPTFLWIPEPRTVYRAIKALPKAHLLIADPSGVRIEAYANRFNSGSIETDDAAVIGETRRVVTDAVHSRLLADVPIGCFLSGGLDSSIVATVASRALPALRTFTIGFEDVDDPYHGRANEAEEAEQLARHLGTDHHTIPVGAEDFRRNLVDFCRYGDQPFAVSSGLGILSVAKRARENGVKVLLSGDGADECFGGYSWYRHLGAWAETAPGPGAAADSDRSLQDVGNSGDAIKVMGQYAPQKRAWALHYYASEREKLRLFNPDYFDGFRVRSSIGHFGDFKAGPSWNPEDYIAQDRDFYLPNEMLSKVDRMTMAHSVEGRMPFVAPAVLAHAHKLRYRHMVRDGTLKWALRRAFADLLPADVLARPKHGFNVPIDHWLRSGWSDLVADAFRPDSALGRWGLIGASSAEAAGLMLADRSRLNGHTLFSFVMLNMWLAQGETG